MKHLKHKRNVLIITTGYWECTRKFLETNYVLTIVMFERKFHVFITKLTLKKLN